MKSTAMVSVLAVLLACGCAHETRRSARAPAPEPPVTSTTQTTGAEVYGVGLSDGHVDHPPISNGNGVNGVNGQGYGGESYPQDDMHLPP